MRENDIFLADGLQFECIGCGNCCKENGEYAYLYLMPKNVDEIGAYLGMTSDEFMRVHCVTDSHGNVHATMVNGQCNFLEGNRCAVYPVRPMQCRSWPFLSENLNSSTWNGALKQICPGIGHGKRYTRDEIEALALARDNANKP
ncbi:MAG: YkgJ family cysteine cluster protein [Deltaproteobacteria bacterium]|nr:YkgJ family cysteine cluster protein [Deltaproteobacteria bacterium]